MKKGKDMWRLIHVSAVCMYSKANSLVEWLQSFSKSSLFVFDIPMLMKNPNSVNYVYSKKDTKSLQWKA